MYVCMYVCDDKVFITFYIDNDICVLGNDDANKKTELFRLPRHVPFLFP